MYDENGEHIPEDPWSSVVDLMSALVLVLFLAVIFFITNYSEVSEELAAEQIILQQRSADLEKTRQSLVSAQASNVDLIAKGRELSAETERLNAERVKLIADKDQLTQDRERLISTQQSLEAKQVKLESDQEKLISEREKLISEREKLISEREQLKSDRAKLISDKESLIGDKRSLSSETERLNAQVVKLQAALQEAKERQASLMTSLASSLEAAKAEGVSVDKQGGKIILKSEVLFSQGDTQLTEAGKRSLASVSRGLIKVLHNPKMRAIVDGVMIEGHASSSGAFEKNLRLSADRSLNTLSYLLSLSAFQGRGASLQKLFFAGAFGENRPVRDARGREDAVKSRRIEIRVLFNQSQLNRIADGIAQ